MNEMLAAIHRQRNRITAATAIVILLGLSAKLVHEAGLEAVLFLSATLAAGLPIAIRACQALRMKAFSIELLITLAVIGALTIGEYLESSMVTFLFLFGDYLESRTLEKTRSSLRELGEMAPRDATVIRDGGPTIVPADRVQLGDRILVRSGEKVPVDGIVATGQALVNEAALTGEPLHSRKQEKDHVLGGSIVDTGYLEIVAERVGEDTAFARMVALVEEAQDAKTAAEKFLAKFARFYTPCIVALSILAYVVTRDVRMAITFLVIACPGALIIGAPVSSVAGIGNGAKHGVLLKGGQVAEKLAKADAIIFDKTGTLTQGKPTITEIMLLGKWEMDEFLRIAAQAEMISEHQIGRIIVKEAEARGVRLHAELDGGEIVKGMGIMAEVEGRSVLIGNRRLMDLRGIPIIEQEALHAVERERDGSTVVYVAIENRLAGTISIADPIRDDAFEVLVSLRNRGVKEIHLLTGDNAHAAAVVAARLRLDSVHAELLPEDKADYVKKLRQKGRVVAMVGDGINDAAAIATADIGIAMGDGGSDISMEAAEVVLMAGRLKQLFHAVALSRAIARNIKQNTFAAVTTVLILLFGVWKGEVHLASGMFIHEASVLLVIGNAMRLRLFKVR